jgi:hypothetical protein
VAEQDGQTAELELLFRVDIEKSPPISLWQTGPGIDRRRMAAADCRARPGVAYGRK